MSKAYDSEESLKAKVIQRLRETKRFGTKPLIATEYRVGSTGVRADLVIASRSTREIVGIEIKSAGDTLKRLTSQLDAYARYFDRIILVAAHRHQANVRQLTIPGLEIWEVEKSGCLALVRPGQLIDGLKCPVDLLTQREKSRYRGMIERDASGARDAFFAAFDDRHGATSERFWQGVGGRVSVEHLATLSRFAPDRAEAAGRQQREAERYASWEAMVAA